MAEELKGRDWRDVQEEHFQQHPEERAEWEASALARAVAIEVIRYRAEHKLSQTALAAKLGMKQPQVARLEIGEHNPTLEMLSRLSTVMGLHILLHLAPTKDMAVASFPEGSKVLAEVKMPTGGLLVAAVV